MNLDSVWAYFVLMAFVMGLAALPLFRFIDNEPGAKARYAAIDGLRGFLALAVFVYHLLVTHSYIETNLWNLPTTRFYALLGPIGVSLFFMITGFLFWGKLLRSQGRPRWRELYISRLFRIGPMYLFVVVIMLFIVFARTNFQLLEPLGVVAGSILQWLALGAIDTQPDVNGYPAKHVVAGVTWTIAYEWAFYASLLATAYFARGKTHLIWVLVAFALSIAGKNYLAVNAMGYAMLFMCGMLVASLLHENLRLRMSDNLLSVAALVCMAAIFSSSSSGYGTVTALLLAVFFYFVSSGATLFGLFTTTSARRLGTISYSLYLMQGLILTLIFSMAPVNTFAMASPQNYWVVGLGCVGVLLLAAALGYAVIERPGIAFGKHLVRRFTPATVAPRDVMDIKQASRAVNIRNADGVS